MKEQKKDYNSLFGKLLVPVYTMIDFYVYFRLLSINRIKTIKNSAKDSNNQIPFEKLTPELDIEISTYKEALDFSLREKDILNIAVTGAYGTGKTSVIESYIRNLEENVRSTYEEKDFLNISLAAFNNGVMSQEKDDEKPLESKETKTAVKNKKELENLNIVEEKIISQLIHQIPSKKIPQSIFKVKEKLSLTKRVFYTIYILLLSFLLIISIFPTLLPGVNDGDMSSWRICTIITLMVLAGFPIFKLITYQLNNKILKKVVFYGNEIQINDDVPSSYFDKFMNDVIYLFIHSDKKVFVFEDLDRFDEPKIFEKLHEVNTLLNKRLRLRNDKREKISFVYLIKDDVFESKERTKLFDFVIPIIPLILPVNSLQKFNEIIEKKDFNNEFSKNLLKKIFIYIDDMRLMKNIINEYYIYKNRLNVDINNDMLLCLIIYKNVFPKDFSDFQFGTSFVNEALNQKQIIIKEEVKRFNDVLSNLIDKRKRKEDEIARGINELESLYLLNEPSSEISVNGKTEGKYANKSEFIQAIKDSEYEVKILYFSSVGYGSRSTKDKNIKYQFEEIHKNSEFQERLELINENPSLIDEDIAKINREKEELKNSAFYQLIGDKSIEYFNTLRDHDDKFNYLNGNKYFQLIVFLLREGLINEKSSEYITYFYDDSITNTDRLFLMNLYSRTSLDTSYEINYPQRLLEELSAQDILKYKVMNKKLSKYIIENKEEEYLIQLIKLVSREKKGRFFLDLYNSLVKEHEFLIDCAIRESYDFLEDIHRDLEVGKEEKSLFYLSSVRIIKMKNVQKLEENYILSSYINDIDFDLIMSDLENIEDYLSIFESINTKLNYLPSSNIYINDVIKLIDKNLINISSENLQRIFKSLGIEVSADNFFNYNISLVRKTDVENVIKSFFSVNVNQYLKVYLEFGMEELVDDINDVVDIFKNEELKTDLGKDYLNRLNSEEGIDYIEEFDEIYWDSIIDKNNYSITSENIITLSSHLESMPDDLPERINNEEINLDFSDYNHDESLLKSVFDYFVTNQLIEVEKYSAIINTFNFIISDITVYNLSQTYLTALIQNSVIELNKDNIKTIIADYPALLEVIEGNEKLEGVIDSKLLQEIFNSTDIKQQEKFKWFTDYIEDLNLEEVLNFINEHGLDNSLIRVLKRGRPEIESDPVHLAIISYYEKRNLITKADYRPETDSFVLSGKDITVNEDYKHIKISDYIFE